MKKWRSIAVLTLVFFLVALSGCSTTSRPKPYTSYVHDYSHDSVDRVLGEMIDTENYLSIYEIYEKEGVANRSITVDGITYTGAYQHTMTYYCSGPAETDGYATESGTAFSIRCDTGELVGWSGLVGTDFDGEYLREDVAEPEQTARQIADDFARENLKDFDRYEISEQMPNVARKTIDGIDYEFALYGFSYTKIVNGYPTMDQMTVVVSSKGRLCSFIKGYVGDFDKVDLRFDKDKLNASILEKARVVYENSSNFTPLNYEISIQGFVLTYDGFFSVSSKVVATGTLDQAERGRVENYGTELTIYTILR